MLLCLEDGECSEVREFFGESGYTMETIGSRFNVAEIPSLHLLKLYLTGVPLEANRLNILLRWFWIGGEVESAAARKFIPERILSLFLQAGVLKEENGRLAAEVRLSPFAEFLVASDHAVVREGGLRDDTVSWPNPSTLMCYRLAMRSPVRRTLDLGTGCGVLALAAAAHSEVVVATDVNARALMFSKFNAALNGVKNVEFREGSAFEPVKGERFDLILSNPPFFIAPSVRHIYSDNEMELDGFCRMLVRESPQYLNENGYCQMLAEWVEVKGQSWHERLGEWFEGSGCDGWVMGSYKRSAMDYAMIRVEQGCAQMSGEEQARATVEWQSYLESRGVETIIGGAMVLRRRPGRNWIRMEEVQSMGMRPFGDYLRRVFENSDYLERHSDEELLESCPAVAASAQLQKRFAAGAEGWKVTGVELQVGDGLGGSIGVQPQVADFVGACNGKRRLKEIADEIAAGVGVEGSAVRREVCGIVRKMAELGIVNWGS